MNSSYTYSEIMSQGESMEKTRERVFSLQKPDKDSSIEHAIFTGCGTSYYLAISAARFYQETTGIPSQAVPASELFIHPQQIMSDKINYKIIAFSRSGTTSEIIKALKVLDRYINVSILAITCNKNTEMISIAQESIVLDHINEKSIVMTQTFTNMLYAIQLYAGQICSEAEVQRELDNLPTLLKEACKGSNKVKEIGNNLSFTRFIYLGTGVSYGLAEEACLKMKEMTQTECEAYSSLEFRHGPISIVDEKTIAIVLSSEKTKELDTGIIRDIQSFGGYTLTIGNTPVDESDENIILRSDGMEHISAISVMPYLQMLAFYRAVALNLDPDKPRNLNQVVKITLPN
ncbi:SIS domain-containing protein [Pseudalkalibacillus salsuginis]|uniref:SIS domain-containing protein n=1 Tax=Pseudalkalibacillus salsuginis TaxID=2910972 RepID=UPI001F308F4A|nr:SIS domain-containing protein [Pseudalkalibacillus salsuginis]MCF6411607.1 SIS domain-containing protein [Pseudalkalibacillus salsuginis]